MRMTKLTVKMINHVAALDVAKNKAMEYAEEGVQEGVWERYTDCATYNIALSKWCAAVDMFESVHGLQENALFDYKTELGKAYNAAVEEA